MQSTKEQKSLTERISEYASPPEVHRGLILSVATLGVVSGTACISSAVIDAHNGNYVSATLYTLAGVYCMVKGITNAADYSILKAKDEPAAVKPLHCFDESINPLG